jgi:cysteine desulfurase/selenocysteine lyase
MTISRYWLTEPQAPPAPEPAQVAFPVEAVRRDFPILHREVDGAPLIWLDNAATTQKPRRVIEAIVEYYTRYNANVHRGAHTLAREATAAYENARATVAGFVGAGAPEEIVFVRGATEAINLVAGSWGEDNIHTGDEIVLTTLEHHSNIVPWQLLATRKRARLRVVPIDEQGAVDQEEYRAALSNRTKLVALSHVSNVLGTVLPVRDMIALAHRNGARVLIDGAQAVGHFPVDVRDLDADFYVLSGHKLFAPTGIGALYGKHDLLTGMRPWQGGGSMIEHVGFDHTTYADIPQRLEAGTGHISGAIGLAAAIDYVRGLDRTAAEGYENYLTRYATAALSRIPGLRLFGTTPDKIAVLAFLIEHTDPAAIAGYLDQQGIAVRAGHHCAQPALASYGVTSLVRPSLAFYNTTQEVDALVAALSAYPGEPDGTRPRTDAGGRTTTPTTAAATSSNRDAGSTGPSGVTTNGVAKPR